MSRSKDVECPYCGKWQEINHDDGYGFEEGESHEQECADCEKNFIFTTSISYYYEAEQAACRNGEPHKLKPITGYPEELYEGESRCELCGDQFRDKEAHEKGLERYRQRMLDEKLGRATPEPGNAEADK